jgi:hypothetical protein
MAKEYHATLTNFSFWYWEYLRRNSEFIKDMDNFYQHFAQRPGDDSNEQLLCRHAVRAYMLDFDSIINKALNSPYPFEKDTIQYNPALYGYVFGDDVFGKAKEAVNVLLYSIEKYGGVKNYNYGPTSDDVLNSVLGIEESFDSPEIQLLHQTKLMFLIRNYDRWEEFVPYFSGENVFTLLVLNRLKPMFKQSYNGDVKQSTAVHVALNCWRTCFQNSLREITGNKIIPTGYDELEEIYKLLFAGKRLVIADESRAVGLWLWDKAQEYGTNNFEELYLKVRDELNKKLESCSTPAQRYLQKTDARAIYETTDKCIKAKEILYVVDKKSK